MGVSLAHVQAHICSAHRWLFFFCLFQLEDWGCPGTLCSVQSKLFSRTLLLPMVLEAANSFLYSFSFQPGLQRRHLRTCQLCTFDLDKLRALQWDFYDAPSEQNFLFIFFFVFQSWQEQSSACLL